MSQRDRARLAHADEFNGAMITLAAWLGECDEGDPDLAAALERLRLAAREAPLLLVENVGPSLADLAPDLAAKRRAAYGPFAAAARARAAAEGSADAALLAHVLSVAADIVDEALAEGDEPSVEFVEAQLSAAALSFAGYAAA